MTAATQNTWDISPSRRPSLTDMGSAVLIDDAVNPPDPNTMPTAASLNQTQYQGAAAGAMIAAVALDIVNNGSTASVVRLSQPGSALSSGSFTVSRLSAGLVQITWAAGTLPTQTVNPTVQMTTDASWQQPIPINISNGVQVKSRNGSGTVTDGNFTIWIY